MNSKELEMRSGMARANIRYYEQEGLLTPVRRENGYRDYSEEDLETLLRISLLRNLGFSVEEIRQLQRGALDFTDAMRSRSAALEAEGQRLLSARKVCDAISQEVTSYSALQPETYLAGLKPDGTARRQDVAQAHPWRRYFARAIDLSLSALPVLFVQYVLFHSNFINRSRWEEIAVGILEWLLLLLAEPLLLSRFGTTAGKWCMGITVTRPDGGRLSLEEAFVRTARVWVYGVGLAIPLVDFACQILSYYRYTRKGEALAWEEDSVEHFDGRGNGRMLLLYAACWALSTSMTLAMALAAALPPQRGVLTVEEFAENVNFYRTFFDYNGRWKLDENGGWTEENPENVIYMGGYDAPSAFSYEEENGVLKTVRWEYSDSGTQLYGTGVENARMAYLALAAAQKKTNLFNLLGVIRQISSDRWAEDADYSAAWGPVEMTYRAQIDGTYFYGMDGFFLTTGAQPVAVALSFEAHVTD